MTTRVDRFGGEEHVAEPPRPRRLARALHRLYRVTVSPLIGDVCRFEPSCSHYALEAVERYGYIRGGFMATARLMRCHPWCRGGFDPVPQPHSRPRPAGSSDEKSDDL